MNSGSFAAMGAYAAEEDRLRRERQEQSNPIDAIGKTALAAGAIAAAILGGRRLSRGTKAEPRTGSSGVGLRNTSATVDLSKADPNTIRRAAGRPPVDIAETVVPSRTPPPVERAAPRTVVERLGELKEFTEEARKERPQGITLVSQLGEEPTVVPKELILPKTITTPTAQEFGIDYYNKLLGKKPTSTDAVDRLLDDPYILSRVNKEYNVEQEAKELAVDNLLSSNRAEQARQQAQKRRSLTESADEIISSLRSEANTAQAAAQGDFTQEYLKTAGYKDVDTMVDQQVANVPRNTNQTLNAIDAAEDQQTGRVYQQLQRNEDLDLNQVEIMEDMAQANRKAMMEGGEPAQMVGYEADASINQVASQLPDGLPTDQAEGALNFAQNRMQEIREAQEAQGYRGLSAEKQMLQGEQGTRIKQASALYAATGDPNVLSLISETPSLPISVQPKAQQLITTQSLEGDAPSELSTSSLYSPFKERVANVNKQEDVDIRMTNRLSGLGATRESIPKIIINPEYAALEEQTNMAMYGMKQGNPTAANIYNKNRQRFREGKVPPREIINPEYLTLSRQIKEAEAVRGEARNIIQTKQRDIAEFPSLYRVADLQEGVRPFYEQTLEGKIIPETLELRKGRRAVPAGVVERPASGSSMRGLSQAVEMESSMPVERELASTEAAAEVMTSIPVRWDPSLHLPAQRTPEGFVYTEEAMRKPTAVTSKSFSTRPSSSPDVARASFDASEEIRRIQRSNPPAKAQALVSSFLQQLKGV